MISLPFPRRRKNSRNPRVPDDVRVYAVGDIHGRADLLEQVFKKIDADFAKAPQSRSIEVFLGDYVDRGPASRQVLELLTERGRVHSVVRERMRQVVFLKGNHETLLMSFLGRPSVLDSWKRLGGLDTLMSYGLTPTLNADPHTQADLATSFGKALPPSHRQFLNDLRPSFTCGDYFFVHAGIRPGVALEKQREEDLLWIRQEFLLCEDAFSKIIVHGHTPVEQVEIRSNRINIDTGAYATGQLSCLVLEADKMHLI